MLSGNKFVDTASILGSLLSTCYPECPECWTGVLLQQTSNHPNIHMCLAAAAAAVATAAAAADVAAASASLRRHLTQRLKSLTSSELISA